MKTKAAVAWKAQAPLTIEEVELAGPKAGEVLVEIMATGICHTDAYTLDGLDSEGLFPSILGHEGAGIVREVASGIRPLPWVARIAWHRLVLRDRQNLHCRHSGVYSGMT